MMGLTHSAVGLLCGTLLIQNMNIDADQALLVTGACVVGSLLPDIDTHTSKMGRVFAPASFLIKLFIGHRTLFHAPLLYGTLALIGWFAFPAYQLLLIGAAVGVASHLLLDMLNPDGVPLLWPLPLRIRIPLCRSGGLIDHLIFGVLCVVLIYVAMTSIQF